MKPSSWNLRWLGIRNEIGKGRFQEEIELFLVVLTTHTRATSNLAGVVSRCFSQRSILSQRECMHVSSSICSEWSAEKIQQCPEAYQKDKRIFGFVKDWASFIFDKAPIRACYCQCAIDWPKVLVKSMNAKHNLRPPDIHN